MVEKRFAGSSLLALVSPIAHEKRTLNQRFVAVLEIGAAEPQYFVQFGVMLLFDLGQHGGTLLRSWKLLSSDLLNYYDMKTALQVNTFYSAICPIRS